MKKKLTGILLLLLFIALPLQGQAKVKAPKKQCHAYVVMDAGSGEVLFGQDANKKIIGKYSKAYDSDCLCRKGKCKLCDKDKV